MQQLGEYIQGNEHIQGVYIGNNHISDKGVETLSNYLIGNTILKELSLFGNQRITDLSNQILLDVVKKSCIISLNVSNTSISEEKRQQLSAALKMPFDAREIPIKSNSKSAAKAAST